MIEEPVVFLERHTYGYPCAFGKKIGRSFLDTQKGTHHLSIHRSKSGRQRRWLGKKIGTNVENCTRNIDLIWVALKEEQ